MENCYGVGTANRYALFMEEGENSLTAIRRKINKETRAKDKQIKKENAEAKKVEAKVPEKPKKPESKPATNDASPAKKEIKEKKPETPKNKEKKPVENVNRKGKEQEKPKNKPENSTQENEIKEKESNKTNDNTGNSRKNYEPRKGPRKFDDHPRTSPPSSKKFNKDDWSIEGSGDNAGERYQEENRNIKENGHGPYNDVKPRGGRLSKGNRGGRNNFFSGDRRKDFDQSSENKYDLDANKNETNGEVKAENEVETEPQKDDEKKNDAEGNETNEQKEVKEYLTLDEYEKLQGTRQKPQYNLRKAGEGEDLTQWKNMKELKKDELFLKNGSAGNQVATNNEADKRENAGNENGKRVTRQKHIDINVHFRDAPVRGRGGRVIRSSRFGYKGTNFDQNENFGGEPRPFKKNREGPPNRGGNRQNAPKMDDEHAFPSLG